MRHSYERSDGTREEGVSAGTLRMGSPHGDEISSFSSRNCARGSLVCGKRWCFREGDETEMSEVEKLGMILREE